MNFWHISMNSNLLFEHARSSCKASQLVTRESGADLTLILLTQINKHALAFYSLAVES